MPSVMVKHNLANWSQARPEHWSVFKSSPDEREPANAHCGLQVYYVPRVPFHLNATMPTLFGGLRLLRCILIREGIDIVRSLAHIACAASAPAPRATPDINWAERDTGARGSERIIAAVHSVLGGDICLLRSSLCLNTRLTRFLLTLQTMVQVHGHQAFSVLANEAMLHARTMAYPVLFTDHSLFGFADAASICTNKALKWSLSDIQAVICVSHTSKENTVLRACLPPERVFVIPNAVDTSKFKPFPRPDPPQGCTTYALPASNTSAVVAIILHTAIRVTVSRE